MIKQYIGSDEHLIDSVYDENEEYYRRQQEEFNKQISEQVEWDYYQQHPHEG